MRRSTTGQDEATRGIAQLEGYLLAQTYRENARTEAEAFADRLPWLTSAQHEEVVSLYTAERMALTRRVLEATVQRCGELRQEYTDRYEQLRGRLLLRVTVALLAMFAACATASAVLLTVAR
ncbi:hypothetical protein GCM10012287_29730 [Streptomyces daqingensis]|uniref:Cytochrome C oxidase subunit I n=1 Tax=Streptomyces daqingensis TaxID=1472640 RepID=A0ABQ2MDV0_9ACTN|nr:hypothetical protein [Streptomyces daqingensis]GGO50310.1 hypothetical protein GCM10012287_29730 [Streptomyces daqingensis]